MLGVVGRDRRRLLLWVLLLDYLGSDDGWLRGRGLLVASAQE
jgi:hypothetical protein